jgi:membrane-associated phospholipid phosphatase
MDPMTRLMAIVDNVLRAWERVDPDLRFRVERWVVAFAIGIFVLLGYFFFTLWNLDRMEYGPVEGIALWTAFDQLVPLWPHAFWSYILYYPLVLMPAFLARDRTHLIELGTAYVVVTGVAWLCWVLFPIRMEYPTLACGGLSCEMLRGLYETDGGVNSFPSLHVGHSVLAAAIFWSYRHRVPVAVLALVMAMAAAVSASTVLLKQHYVIDVPAGILLGLGGWVLTRRLVPVFVTGIGSGTTYPDYKPAPFIVSSEYDGVDMVTVS